MFKPGDIVWSKSEFLAKGETQESTMGVVIDYAPENDRLSVGVLNPEDFKIPPIFSFRGRFFEVVPTCDNRPTSDHRI
jgi:hypothetical protein